MGRAPMYQVRVYRLSLSTWEGISPGAHHWYCKLHWKVLEQTARSSKITYHEADAERPTTDEPDGMTMRFDDKRSARAAGLRLARKLGGDGEGSGYYMVTECSAGNAGCCETLVAPGNLRARLNRLWRKFEELYGPGTSPADEGCWEVEEEWCRLVAAAEAGA